MVIQQLLAEAGVPGRHRPRPGGGRPPGCGPSRRLGHAEIAGKLHRLRPHRELRLARWRRTGQVVPLCHPGAAQPKPVGAGRRLDDGRRGVHAQRDRRPDRLPLPGPRRQPGDGALPPREPRCGSVCSSTGSRPARITLPTRTRTAPLCSASSGCTSSSARTGTSPSGPSRSRSSIPVPRPTRSRSARSGGCSHDDAGDRKWRSGQRRLPRRSASRGRRPGRPRLVTHLVVEPHGRAGLARLVPIGLADLSDRAEERPGQVRLRCTEAEFMSLEAAEETLAEFVPGYPDPVQLLPPGWRGAGGPTADGGTILSILESAPIDAVPPGEVEEHRGRNPRARHRRRGRAPSRPAHRPGTAPGRPRAGQARGPRGTAPTSASPPRWWPGSARTASGSPPPGSRYGTCRQAVSTRSDAPTRYQRRR